VLRAEVIRLDAEGRWQIVTPGTAHRARTRGAVFAIATALRFARHRVACPTV